VAAPTFVDVENDPDSAGGNANSISFAWADITGEATDQTAIIALYKESTAAYTATPAGANQFAGFPLDNSTGGFKYRTDLWWYKVPASPATLTWSWTGNTWRFGKLLLYSGLVTTETPIINLATDTEAAQNTQPDHPGITITRSESGLLWICWNFSSATLTPPAGYAQRNAAGEGACEILVMDDLTTTTGVTGNVAGTLSDPEYALTGLMEIAVVGGGAAQDTPELYGRPRGLRGDRHMRQILAQ
jgi:hypothetical protein